MSFWHKLTTRQKTLVMISVVLMLAVIAVRIDLIPETTPTPSNIEDAQSNYNDLLIQLDQARKMKKLLELEKLELRKLAFPCWSSDEKPIEQEIADAFNTIERKARVDVNTVGKQDESKISENIRAIEFRVSMNGTMKDVKNLLLELKRSEKPFFWADCTINPENYRDPQRVRLNGRLRAYVLSEEAVELLSPAAASSENMEVNQ